MAFEAGFKARFLQGDFALSAWTDSIAAVDMTDMLDVTVHESTGGAKAFIPGQTTGTMAISGVMDVDGSSTALLGQLNTWKGGSDEPQTFGHKGFAFGNELLLANGLETNLTSSATVAGRVNFSVASTNDGVACSNGFSLHDLTAETSSSSSAEHDGSASSAGGILGHLHVTSYSGLTSIAIKIQHATSSGGSYSDLLTFTSVTGVTSERKTAAGTVNRFLKLVWTVTGTGSATFAVGFARL